MKSGEAIMKSGDAIMKSGDAIMHFTAETQRREGPQRMQDAKGRTLRLVFSAKLCGSATLR
jgi:hypothetical protein